MRIVLLVAALCVASAAAGQSHRRYYDTTTVRIGNRVISVGDSIEQLRQNRPVAVQGSLYTFRDRYRTAHCYVSRGYCRRLQVTGR